MKKLLLSLLLTTLTSGFALAETAAPANCEALAVAKNGKPLTGAAKANFMKKCEKENAAPAAAPADKATPADKVATGCEAKAIGKNGKPLAGAAKTAFIKKCEKDAKAS